VRLEELLGSKRGEHAAERALEPSRDPIKRCGCWLKVAGVVVDEGGAVLSQICPQASEVLLALIHVLEDAERRDHLRLTKLQVVSGRAPDFTESGQDVAGPITDAGREIDPQIRDIGPSLQQGDEMPPVPASKIEQE
jgi:hypothetical protein